MQNCELDAVDDLAPNLGGGVESTLGEDGAQAWDSKSKAVDEL